MSQYTLLASNIKLDKKTRINHKMILNLIKDSVSNMLNFIHQSIFIKKM